MLAAQPFRWTSPATWPWSIYVWLALVACAGLPSLWRWFQRRRVTSWPIADGRIEQTTIDGAYAAELLYSYSIGGTSYGGVYRREFSTEAGAESFLRDLKGRAVTVRYGPGTPLRSIMLEHDVEALLLNRTPATGDESVAPTSVPNWIRPFVWVFVGFSATGLLISLWIHTQALMGRAAVATLFWILNLGMFAVWIPSALISRRLGASRRSFFNVALKGSPAWMRYPAYGFVAYAFVNFTTFIAQGPHGVNSGNPPPLVWRGFSGYWMAFYSASLAVLYSATKTTDSSNR